MRRGREEKIEREALRERGFDVLVLVLVLVLLLVLVLILPLMKCQRRWMRTPKVLASFYTRRKLASPLWIKTLLK